jgi:phage shock protein PspC (stress-responsive transcriptional regulator)
MNEITHIHLGRQPFTIAVDAHQALRHYLQAIETAVGDNAEVVNEVELRMAELLAEHGVTAEKVILKEDVEYLKAHLGKPADFGGDDDDDQKPKSKSQAKADADSDDSGPKRLFRDMDRAMFAGVCAGLAKYFGVDAVIIRLLFVALIFCGGAGVLLYGVLWLIVPEAKTGSDRLQMQGLPVTVEGLKRVVERADLNGAAHRARLVIAPFAQTVARVVLSVLGTSFMVIAAGLLIGVATSGLYVWMNNGIRVYGEHFFPIGIQEIALVVCGLALIAVIAMVFLLCGTTMVWPKRKLPRWLPASLGGMFILLAASNTALAMSVMPHINDRAQAAHHTVTLQVQPFSKVMLDGKTTNYTYVPDTAYKVLYHYVGKSPQLTAQTGQDGTLTVKGKPATYNGCSFLCTYDADLMVEVHGPHLQDVTVGGDSNMFMNSAPLNDPDLTMTVVGRSSFDLRSINPTKVVFVSDPGTDHSQLTLTGLRPNAFQSDDINGYTGFVNISRASTVELQTTGQCTTSHTLVNLLSYPDTLTINGQTLAGAGDLKAKQDPAKASDINCVALGVVGGV